MGCQTTANGHILLKTDYCTIKSITEEIDNNITEHETITLDNFLKLFSDNSLKDLTVHLDKLSILDLSYCNLTDLPLSCQNLNLKHLNISHNKLTNVPICIYNGLENLEHLDLSYNPIENFDMQPACISCIKVIRINNTSLNTLPKWITNFQSTNLEELNFSYNKSENYEYSKNSYNISKIKLKRLELQNSHLIDKDFKFLKCFESLEYLDISNYDSKTINKLYEVDDLFVNLKWKQLEILKVNSLFISIFPEGIAWIETLKELYISKNCISWLPDGIEYMINLQILDISFNTLIAIPDKIVKLEMLEVILASNNCIEACPDFSLMSSLKTLDLYNNLLDLISLDCDKLDKLDLEQNYFIPNNYVSYDCKRDELRRGIDKKQVRCDGQKSLKLYEYNYHQDKVTSDEETDSSICLYDKTVTKTNIVDDEDWDSPVVIRERNPDIDSLDEEWEGEEPRQKIISSKVRKKIYVEDEDWMFEDAEETVIF